MAENKKKEAPKPIRNDSLLESIEALKKEELSLIHISSSRARNAGDQ